MMVALLLAAVASADLDSRVEAGILTALETGQARAAHGLLDTDHGRSDFLADTRSLARVCGRAAESAPRLAEDPGDAARLAALLLAWATEAAEGGPEDAPAHRALGHALLASGRIARAVAPKDAAAGTWMRAADAFEKAYGIAAADGDDAGSAVEALAEGAFVASADIGGALDRASTVAAAAVGKHPANLRLLRQVSFLELARARRALAAKDRPGAEAALERAATRLAPLLKGEATDIDIGTAWNAIIDFVKSNPKEVKKPRGEYLMVARDLGQFLQVEVPHSRFWARSKDRNSLYQYDNSFELVRILDVNANDWGTEYALADMAEVGGDDVRGLATSEYDVAVRGLKSEKGTKPPYRARLSGNVGEGWACDYQGIDQDKDYLSVRCWYFKSMAGHRHTFRFAIWEHREGVAADAISKAVIESMREKARQ
jgi:hypothetical protein